VGNISKAGFGNQWVVCKGEEGEWVERKNRRGKRGKGITVSHSTFYEYCRHGGPRKVKGKRQGGGNLRQNTQNGPGRGDE